MFKDLEEGGASIADPTGFVIESASILAHRALSGGVQASHYATPPKRSLFVELCAIVRLVWAGPLMTGLDTPMKGPLGWRGPRNRKRGS